MPLQADALSFVDKDALLMDPCACTIGNTSSHTIHVCSPRQAIKRKTSYFVPHKKRRMGNNIGEVIDQMDKLYHSYFGQWVKDHKNITPVSIFLKRILHEYDMERICQGIIWITEGWPLGRKAELIVKVFYNWGIKSPHFAQLIRGVTKGWSLHLDINELIIALMYGEEQETTAVFTSNLIDLWATEMDFTQFLTRAVQHLHWSPCYLDQFLLHLAQMHTLHYSIYCIKTSHHQNVNSQLWYRLLDIVHDIYRMRNIQAGRFSKFLRRSLPNCLLY